MMHCSLVSQTGDTAALSSENTSRLTRTNRLTLMTHFTVWSYLRWICIKSRAQRINLSSQQLRVRQHDTLLVYACTDRHTSTYTCALSSDTPSLGEITTTTTTITTTNITSWSPPSSPVATPPLFFLLFCFFCRMVDKVGGRKVKKKGQINSSRQKVERVVRHKE